MVFVLFLQVGTGINPPTHLVLIGPVLAPATYWWMMRSLTCFLYLEDPYIHKAF